SYKLHKTSTDFISLVRQVLDGFQVAAKEKNIRLQHNLPNTPLFLTIDRDNLEIVLYNLLSNALKYTYPNTEVTVACNINTAINSVTLSVQDQGPGVKEEALCEIFELFHMESTSARSAEKSSGIGLSLAKELIQLHGGEIWAKNRDNGGLEVTFSLLLEKDEGGESRPVFHVTENIDMPMKLGVERSQEEHSSQKASEQVLVVEDNEEIRG